MHAHLGFSFQDAVRMLCLREADGTSQSARPRSRLGTPLLSSIPSTTLYPCFLSTCPFENAEPRPIVANVLIADVAGLLRLWAVIGPPDIVAGGMWVCSFGTAASVVQDGINWPFRFVLRWRPSS